MLQAKGSLAEGIIYMTAPDRDRLAALVEGYRLQGREDQDVLQRLEDELDRAVVVEADEIPADVVTLDSRVRLVDLDSGEELLFTPVLPSRANADEGRISVLFRGRGMKRCLAEGRQRFELFVGAAVLANNLLRIAQLLRAKRKPPRPAAA